MWEGPRKGTIMFFCCCFVFHELLIFAASAAAAFYKVVLLVCYRRSQSNLFFYLREFFIFAFGNAATNLLRFFVFFCNAMSYLPVVVRAYVVQHLLPLFCSYSLMLLVFA